MERRSWPWRKKAGTKVEKTSLDSQLGLAISIQAYEEPPPKVVEQEAPRIRIEDAQLLKAISLRQEAEEKVKSLTEKLSVAIEDMKAKEDLVKQQSNVAQEAVSGWEKAEAEALSLKKELEASVQQKNIVEERVVRLDGALKECTRQARQARDEQEQKIQEVILQKTRELEKIKGELDAKQVELRRRLLESDAENSAMTKSLQERARTIVESNAAKARAETEVKVLQVRLDALEKEISSLKYELHLLNKELEIRTEEREYSKKSADAAHKLHLENTKKIAQLDSECQRLRNLVRKKLPGPAALAQMRMEVEGLRWDVASDGKRRRPVSSRGTPSPTPTDSQQQIRDATKEIESLTERMVSMEVETQLLKETLAKRNEELQASRQLCARTANKLSSAEDQLESVQGTPRGSKNMVDLQIEASVGSRSEDTAGGIDEEVNCAESWASALITELSHFKKGKAPHAGRQSTESCNFDPIDESVEQSSIADPGTNVSKNERLEIVNLSPEERKTIKALASKEAELQVANLMCKDVSSKLSVLEDQFRALYSDENADAAATNTQISEGLTDVVQKVSKLDKVLDEMRIAVASLDDDTDAEDNGHIADGIPDNCSVDQRTEASMVVIDPNPRNAISGASLGFVLGKLISFVEMLRNTAPPLQNPTSPAAEEVDSSSQRLDDHLPKQNPRIEKEMQCLVAAKESCAQGKASVMEFLLRLGLVLSELWNLESSDLESLLSKEQMRSEEEAGAVGDNVGVIETDPEPNVNANADQQSPKGIPSSCDDEQREALEKAKAELENQLSATDEELQSMKSELMETKQLVTDLQARVTDLQSAEKKLADREAERTELQVRSDKAETEVNKLQESVASLTTELAAERKQYKNAMTTCEELEQKLQKYVDQNQLNNSRRFADDDDSRLRKEREVAAAKQKLAECQRSIVVLGKQLTALASPPNHSPAVSFDSTSMDSANDGIWAAELFPVTATMDEFQNHDASRGHQYHHHRRRPPVSAPQGQLRNDRHRWSPSQGCYFTSSGAALQPCLPPQYGYQILPDPASTVTPAVANGRHSYPPTNDYTHGSALMYGSPTTSPPRDLQLRARRKSGNAVRTSLTEAMNRAAVDDAAVGCDFVEHRKAGSSSGLGRLFSRSKNRR